MDDDNLFEDVILIFQACPWVARLKHGEVQAGISLEVVFPMMDE